VTSDPYGRLAERRRHRSGSALPLAGSGGGGLSPRYVEARVRRREDPILLTGRARFIDDLRLAGMVSVAFLRSPHAHARLRGVDARGALGSDGVVAVLTGDEVSRLARPILGEMSHPGFKPCGWPALAQGKVRFAGEPVVAVAARDRYRAEDALERVRVDYEPLPAVVDAEAAARPEAPRVHDELADNVLFHARHDSGGVGEAFARAEIRIGETLRHGRCTSAPMETRGAVATWDAAEGALTVWATTQSPHMHRSGLAGALGLPESRIRVLCPAVGGGFGPKMHLYPEDIAVCLLAMRLRRPVKWLEDRRENLLACAQAREHVNHLEVAATRDGRLLAFRARLVCDAGAYSNYPVTAALEPGTAAGIIPGPYRVAAYSYEALGVATNKCPAGAYRGVGMALGTFVRERLVDMVAQRAGLDAAEVRRRNLIGRAEFPYTTASGLVLDSGDPEACLAEALAAAGYERLREDPPPREGRRRGIGVCAYTEFTGMGAGTFRRRGMVQVSGYDAATVRVEPSGEVRGFLSATSQGQGHATAFAQVLADEMGVPLEAVTIVEGDTERCPDGSGSFASRSTVVSGGALILAARRVREKVLALAAHMLEAAPADLVVENGAIGVRGLAARQVTVADVARRAYRPASGTLPPGMDPALEATQHYDPPPATFSMGAHVAAVDVDPETGQVEIVRYVVAEDCGRMVNPMLVEGQVHGAVAQGIGGALHERLVYDGDGQALTTSFMDYVIPTGLEVPPVQVVHVDTRPPGSPSGFKGMAEGGTIGATSAVANAVADALAPLGAEVREVPLSPDRVHRLVHDALKGGRR
jgi:carbon-monoxide dehydrogenase large subunit